MGPKKIKFILIFCVIAAALIAGAIYVSAQKGLIKPLAVASAPEISLSPSSGSYSVGQTFNVNINLDTAGKTIDGADIHYLNYNPVALEVQDADPNTSGLQIGQGSLFPTYIGNSVDNTNGRIALSGITSLGGTGFSGSGTMATITFKALQVSTNAALTLDFDLGATTDSNMVEHGTTTDVLASVINANFTLTAPVSAPTIDLRVNRKNGPLTVVVGKTVTLSWTSTNAASCTASGGWSGDKSVSGSEETPSLATQQNYILTCSNSSGTATDNVVVNIRTKGKK